MGWNFVAFLAVMFVISFSVGALAGWGLGFMESRRDRLIAMFVAAVILALLFSVWELTG